MKKDKLNVKLTVISWHLLILYLIGVIISLANVFIDSDFFYSIHRIIKIFNWPLYILTLTSIIVSFYVVLKNQTKSNVICLIYSVVLLILEIFVIRIFYIYLSVLY